MTIYSNPTEHSEINEAMTIYSCTSIMKRWQFILGEKSDEYQKMFEGKWAYKKGSKRKHPQIQDATTKLQHLGFHSLASNYKLQVVVCLCQTLACVFASN